MNYYVNKILEEKTITSYLEEKGIYPSKKSGDKLFYICPIHKGDKDPSFIVYPVGTKGRNYQTYHCFSCHSGVSLINLKSDLENIPIKESIKFFLKNIQIDNEDVRKSIIEDFKNNRLGVEENRSIELLMLLINTTCRRHIVEECNNDEDEILFFEEFFKKVDEVAISQNSILLKQIADLLHRGNEKRSENYKAKKEQRIADSSKWRI